MSENVCRYAGDRDQAIVSYLYSDDGGFDLAEREAFDRHLATCSRCRAELSAFEGVRASLGRWSPPRLRSENSLAFGVTNPQGRPSSPRSWWRDIPAWAQVAAAMLCLGAGAGLANLNVRYNTDGLQVRTGWLTASPAPVADRQPTASASRDEAPWRAELTALEERLRTDLRQPPAGAAAASPANAASPDVLRRVQALVAEGEQREKRELALRLAEAVREMNAQRQADLVRIDRNIGAVQNDTGREMLRQRNEMLNYVSVRTALQRPQ
jgi:hypothetical protein